MNNIEYDIIDELYFVISFDALLENIAIDEKELVQHLIQMEGKGWIRCFKDVFGEEPSEGLDLRNLYKDYYYLASKEGLKAHNSL